MEVPAPPAQQQADGEEHDHQAHQRLGRALGRVRAGRPAAGRSGARTLRASRHGRAPGEPEPARPAGAVLGIRRRSASRRRRGGRGRTRGAARAAAPPAARPRAPRRRASSAIQSSSPNTAVPPFRGQARRRHGELAVGDPAVVRRQKLRDQHAQAAPAEQRGRPGEQRPVLEDAARQDDRVRARATLGRRLAGRSPWPRRERCGSAPRRAAREPRARGRARPRGPSRRASSTSGRLRSGRQRVGAALRAGRPPPRARPRPGPRSSPRRARRRARRPRRRAGPRSR